MKINLDCVRDVMLCVEANTVLHQRCYFIDYALNSAQEFVGDLSPTPDYQAELETKYHNEELLYHLKYCIESGSNCVDVVIEVAKAVAVEAAKNTLLSGG